MNRLDHGPRKLQQQRPLGFYDSFPAQDTIPPERNLEIGDVVKISKTEFFCLGQEGLRNDCKLSYALGDRRESLGSATCGDDLNVFIRVDAQPPQGETESEVGRCSQSVDAAGFAFELFYCRDARQRDYVIDKGRHHTDDHHRVGAGQPGTRQCSYRNTSSIDLTSEQGLKYGGTIADGDDFRLNAHFLQQFSILDHPDWAVRRAKTGPGKPDSFLRAHG